jgi:hypothetical protein
MLSSLLNLGVKKSMSRQRVRQHRLTNMLMVILMGFGMAVLVPIIFENGINSSVYLDLFSIGLIIFLLWLNKNGHINITRLVISVYPALIIFTATILVKLLKPENVAVFDYIVSRILLLGLFIVPFLLFSYIEKRYLVVSLSFPFLLIILFDPIHFLFGVGYDSFFGPMPKSYIVIGIYTDIALIFLAGSVYYFKANIESLLQKNISLSDDLNGKNIELSELFEELESTNVKLADQVEVKNSELRDSNDELIRHNNELQQFSNTLSHNLRAPWQT